MIKILNVYCVPKVKKRAMKQPRFYLFSVDALSCRAV